MFCMSCSALSASLCVCVAFVQYLPPISNVITYLCLSCPKCMPNKIPVVKLSHKVDVQPEQDISTLYDYQEVYIVATKWHTLTNSSLGQDLCLVLLLDTLYT